MEAEKQKKTYDNKAYYQNFKNKHPSILTDKIVCDKCGGKYTYYNKSRHNTAKKHQRAIETMNEREKVYEVIDCYEKVIDAKQTIIIDNNQTVIEIMNGHQKTIDEIKCKLELIATACNA